MNEWTPPAEFDGYRIVRPLGRGGMGRVFLGHDALLDRAVAIKFIAAAEPGAEWRERFLTEGRAVARLSHPNVVAVYRVGEVAGRPYLITEYVDGDTLATVPTPVPTDVLVRMAIGLARGLAAAHEQGVLHRDLKPTNAMVTRTGEPKLLDFGVAKLFDERGASVSGVVKPMEEPPGPEQPWTVTFNSPVSRALGTPMYMAPEVRAGAPASRRSDVFSLGAVLYELWTGTRYLLEDGTFAPGARTRLKTPSGRDGRFATVVDRCLEVEPLARFASGRELLEALESIDAAVKTPFRPTGNPYRGLNPFEAEHRSLFFGRESDIESMVGRVRRESVLVVVGDSGVGKSSLCRAGLIPAIEEGQLDDGRSWTGARLVPGRQPLTALAESLAPIVGQDAANLEAWFREEALALERALKPWLRSRPRAGLVVFVDQAEELFTQAEAAEAERFSELLLSLVQTGKATRLVLCVRSDFVSRLATLRGLAGVVSHALFLVGPLSRERLRSTIVSPARQAGVSFESESIVDGLVLDAERSAGGLPLLEFALTELWEARDRARGLVTESAVVSIGGVGGALARHADRVLRQLLPEERAEARRLLLTLVTAEGTRATMTRDELLAASGPARAALEGLIRGRLVVVRELQGVTQYELAHDSLVTQWPTLVEWVETDAEKERSRRRIRSAAEQWERLDRADDALLRGRSLAEATGLDPGRWDALSRDFVEASVRWTRRQRIRRWSTFLALPFGVSLVVAAAYARSRAEIRAHVSDLLAQARSAAGSAEPLEREARTKRPGALALFDSRHQEARDRAEPLWAEVLAAESSAERALASATALADSALLADPARNEARQLMADILARRLVLAEQQRSPRVDELLARLRSLEQGEAIAAARTAPGTVRLQLMPVDAACRLEKYVTESGLLEPRPVGLARSSETIRLEPGSHRLLCRASGHADLTLPLMVAAGEAIDREIALPLRSEIPRGFILVEEGPFLTGTADDEVLRVAQASAPLHPVEQPAFLVGINEVTFGEWIEFLEAARPGDALRPLVRTTKGALSLTRTSAGWKLFLQPTSYPHDARAGEPVQYPGRKTNVAQSWERMPVLGIGPRDAAAYTRWLEESGRLPGARLCSELEWEKAARGVDGRTFTTGQRLPAALANVDETYGQTATTFGPDEVGRHPESDSPYGIHDMQGNALEIVRSSRPTPEYGGKGGAWYYDANYSGRLSTIEPLDVDTRASYLGFRVCADAKERAHR